MSAMSGFYSEGQKGKNSPVIWISSVCVILTSFYFITGAFSGLTSHIMSLSGGLWHPDLYSPGSFGAWSYFWSVFYGWTSGAIFGLAGLYFTQTKLRERSFLNLLTSAPKFRYKRAFVAAFVFLMLKLIIVFFQSIYLGNADVPIWSEPQAVPGFNIERTSLAIWTYLVIAPFLLIFIILFSVFQEALFRGFIDQGLTYKFKQTLPAFIISAFLYTLWNIWTYDIYYGALPFLIGMFIIGLSMSVISSNDEGLEAAIGIQVIWAILYNLGIGPAITFSPETTLWTFGEPKYSAATVLENLTIFFAIIVVLKFWKAGLLPNGKRK